MLRFLKQTLFIIKFLISFSKDILQVSQEHHDPFCNAHMYFLNTFLVLAESVGGVKTMSQP